MSQDKGAAGSCTPPSRIRLAEQHWQYDSKMTLAVIEEVDNHMPEVVIIDEISTGAELKACQSMAEI
ncbi:hypothetical protein Tco_0507561 [Tanacetum coccineum]